MAGFPDDFRVTQTYGELGQLIHEAVIDELCDDGDPTTVHPPLPETVAWATTAANHVRDAVLSKLDAAE